ncbi:Fe-only nitrogenase accessory protein AnfO [Ethanoligenens harbinense]|uniref:Fe-only nitrogenase accessory protein AnfO n=1 Tax=Ethanoligenens harbinense (strain DSM 18485 / JCM 12961 / CGMCC 1.5033 / YUAN-3) TaxID=663278 RepID=E6U4U8_ETHHY|nr:Fe-only nitrogenase accessory protein AnfO [Ethanoligenens harbinense]ADU27833.1 Fe-only nitrogenase accessory protein AnfO [Ethanoligenens harbinense YUAN-3]AVQ96856.1 Fe-only nitrogenase accessory protein AnfO [Ethanoligenens harbinense YUAN-3]AYF39518.1 Fe-only nitrogenase accessory protein AnfO [Ethanoligenens harbinense]AYF42343.1 Fe-only nitrogenase accessory protein AnfO [Ethanoligenens harbinense]QCN93097.1 Fe-only nitrogenase accessory protein AnfO [Ethanoligenens harbinense]
MQIAVIENNEGKTHSIFEPGFLAVYEHENKEWKELSRKENPVPDAQGIAAVRQSLSDVVESLPHVRILIASDLSGVAFSIFESAGFEIFLVKSDAASALASVRKTILEDQKESESANNVDISQFFEHGTNKGDFVVNLQQAQMAYPQLSSKKILLDHVKRGEFNRLDVIVSHTPKWFDRELPLMGFQYETVNILPDKKTLRVSHAPLM